MHAVCKSVKCILLLQIKPLIEIPKCAISLFFHLQNIKSLFREQLFKMVPDDDENDDVSDNNVM